MYVYIYIHTYCVYTDVLYTYMGMVWFTMTDPNILMTLT